MCGQVLTELRLNERDKMINVWESLSSNRYMSTKTTLLPSSAQRSHLAAAADLGPANRSCSYRPNPSSPIKSAVPTAFTLDRTSPY